MQDVVRVNNMLNLAPFVKNDASLLNMGSDEHAKYTEHIDTGLWAVSLTCMEWSTFSSSAITFDILRGLCVNDPESYTKGKLISGCR